MLDLSSNPPTSIDELAERCRGLRSLRGPERTELFELLHKPLNADELEFDSVPPSADGEERRMIKALKEIVVARATELDIPDGLLCSRRHLETLYLSRKWPTMLEGWRRTILHDALMARLAGE